jgi:hypothetical protein
MLKMPLAVGAVADFRRGDMGIILVVHALAPRAA